MTGTNLTVSDSHVEGDVIHGNKIVAISEAKPVGLASAIKSIKECMAEAVELSGYIEDLAEYVQDRVGRDVIGLEQKLINGQRPDLIEHAVYLKNKFGRFLAKKQLSHSEQKIFAHVLASINTAFNQQVRPLILDNRSKAEVDKAVHEFIIEPIYTTIVATDDAITSEMVLGMLYFLTGKCHLVWDAKC
jgi:hypothetical protein